MGHMFSIEFENVAVTAAQDFFEILPATQKPVALHALHIDQSTEAGDAAEEFLRYKVIRGNTTGGSGGASVTPVKLHPDAPTAGSTCEINNTTEASAGTEVDIHSGTFNVRAGLVQIWTPECRPVSKNANYIVVRLMAAPADSVTMSGTLYFEEL